MSRSFLPCALLALALAAGWNEPAAAAAGVAVRELEDGPVLTGGELMWTERRGERRLDLWRASPAGRGARVATLREAAPILSSFLVGDAGWYALMLSAGQPGDSRLPNDPPDDRTLLLGRAGGPPRELLRCRAANRRRFFVSVSLGDGALASRLDCDPDAPPEVRSPPDAAPRALPTAQQARIAGRYVVYYDAAGSGSFVVFDWLESREVYRVAPADVRGGVLAWSDVQGDGRIAVVVRSERRESVWTASEFERPRPLPLVPRRSYRQLRLANDHIGFLRSAWPAYEVGVLDIASGRTTVAATVIPEMQMDFDGRTLAWSAPACLGVVLRTWRVGAQVERPRRPRCRLALASRPRLRAGGRLRLRIRCSGYTPNGCPSRIVVSTLSGRRLGRGRTWATALGEESATIRLARRVQRVRITATTRDALGRRERRSVVVAL